MKQKVTYKTKDGQLKEQVFDDFNEFADLIQDAALDYYTGNEPEMSVETLYNDMTRIERVTNNESRPEFLS